MNVQSMSFDKPYQTAQGESLNGNNQEDSIFFDDEDTPKL